MNPKDRRFDMYLHDMLTSMNRIEEYINGLEFLEFKRNYMVVDAVVRNFEIIGEASKHIPEKITIQYFEIPWKKMYALRNIISHEYFGLDYEMIWQIAKNELPKNKLDLIELIEKEKNNLD